MEIHQEMVVLHPFFRFSKFCWFEVFKHNIRHMYIFAKNGIIIIPQESSYMGMAVSRGTFCCNVQDLFHFLGIGCARGSKKKQIYGRPL